MRCVGEEYKCSVESKQVRTGHGRLAACGLPGPSVTLGTMALFGKSASSWEVISRRGKQPLGSGSRSALPEEAVLGERLPEVVTPGREVGVGVSLEVPADPVSELDEDGREHCAYSSMYAAVGKSAGSQPMLIASGSW